MDIWRIRNPNKKEFTRSANSRGGIVESRLDYWLVSMGITYLVKNIEIIDGLDSDHSIITMKLNLLNTCKRGKSYWKFNNDLLTDKIYIEKIKTIIGKIKDEDQMENKNTLWEFTKCEIRGLTMKYAKKKAKKERHLERELSQKVQLMKGNINGDETKYREYKQCKAEWEYYHTKKTKGIILRSKAKWVEEGEKNTKYFLNLEKRNQNSTYIKTLINKNGEEINNIDSIIKEEETFYKELYRTRLDKDKIKNIEETSFTRKENIPQLSAAEKLVCEELLNMIDIGKALKELPNNKSPGCDGFTTNFYKFFWVDIKELLLDSYTYSFEHGLLTQEQRRGILNILPKKGKDLRYLAHWRPVSLLTTDYKILTKALAMKLQKIIPSIVNSDQVGYIKKRYIGENIRIIQDIMLKAEQDELDAYITQIDFEKAFDSIEWPFLLKTLKDFNFGENFIKWIKILYTDIQSCVGNNGSYSAYFKLTRSIRQGCPISALLFLLVAEMIAIDIRNDREIIGIEINDCVFKIALNGRRHYTIYCKH